jgi:hypothetical protein
MAGDSGSSRRDFLKKALGGAAVLAFATSCRCDEDNVKWSDEASDPSEAPPRKPEPAPVQTPPPAPEPAPEVAPEELPKLEKPVKKKGKR